jgi:hypothetical protein
MKLVRIASSFSVITCVILVPAVSAPPAWWATREVYRINTGTGSPYPAEDYAPVTLGQLKWIATTASAELDANLTNGAGPDVTNLINSWSTLQGNGTRIPIVGSNTEDYAIANLGQVKNVMKPFWDRLIAEHRAIKYPWTTAAGDEEDFAIANLGQLKLAFAFAPANPDQDGDGILDLQEYNQGTDPHLADTDGDGEPDPSDGFPLDPTRKLPALQITLLGPQ